MSLCISGKKTPFMLRDNNATNSEYWKRKGLKPFDVVDLVFSISYYRRYGYGTAKTRGEFPYYFCRIGHEEAIQLTPMKGDLKARIDRCEIVHCGVVNKPKALVLVEAQGLDFFEETLLFMKNEHHRAIDDRYKITNEKEFKRLCVGKWEPDPVEPDWMSRDDLVVISGRLNLKPFEAVIDSDWILSEDGTKRLTDEAVDNRRTFESRYEDSGCRCHSHPPCGWCTHEGNPRNQSEDESCWIPIGANNGQG